MKQCSICGSSDTAVICRVPLRTGTGMKRTQKPYDIYRCAACDTIWHENDAYSSREYYETAQYRMELEGSSSIEDFYARHDRECLDKFRYTGTDIFRNKIVADIGCGGGGWLDFLKGVARTTVAVEPSETYRKHLKEKGHRAYPYMNDAARDFPCMTDVLASFDEIEHVDDPQLFADDAFRLLKEGGRLIVGTPTDLRHLRELLGAEFDSFVFSVQHPWVFAEKGLRLLFEKAGFKDVTVKQYMRYGLGNVFAWLKERTPNGDVDFPCISQTVNEAWKANLAETGYGDYLVVHAVK
ncbi:MAG: class I SAM-dependent methyltransferase [Bacteroidales bacterium]|jgi:SAM-dependent methyltransferase|nr:class I SAM-dependent methyltransferase [Bacteroidales bacterium]